MKTKKNFFNIYIYTTYIHAYIYKDILSQNFLLTISVLFLFKFKTCHLLSQVKGYRTLYHNSRKKLKKSSHPFRTQELRKWIGLQRGSGDGDDVFLSPLKFT